MPPPFETKPENPWALLPLIVLFLMVRIPPTFKMPPPPKGRYLDAQLRFPLIVLLLSVRVPLLWMPPPSVASPCWTVNPERVTAALEIVTTVLTPPPSMIVVVAP